MAQYISKSALVAEIESRISDIETSQKAGLIKKRDADKKIFLLKSVLSLIDTLEVREMDLEKELSYDDYIKFFKEHPDISDDWGFDETWLCAKYFFELGLKSQKGKTNYNSKQI